LIEEIKDNIVIGNNEENLLEKTNAPIEKKENEVQKEIK
jgi:hypothetical protein